MTPPVEVHLWGVLIGALSYHPEARGPDAIAAFEYAPEFLRSGVEIAPLTMPSRRGVFRFDNISRRTFKGLPGIIADSLPDKFGTQIIDKHLAAQGYLTADITALDRLHYVSDRAMGALEYKPPSEFAPSDTISGGILNLSELTELANLVLRNADELTNRLAEAKSRQQALELIRVGTSAGGARAKALIALDEAGAPKVGHIDHGPNHTYWLLKFDGIRNNADKDAADPPGVTVLEYIYALIARDCGIAMPRCRLLEHGGLRHFMAERFDRIGASALKADRWRKMHYASWCGIAHADRDVHGAYSYEQLILVMRQLGLPQSDLTELYRRAVFNIVGRNHDDHTKNFGFLMERSGVWSLSPAFDMTYAYDPQGVWTRSHQISLNNKTEDYVRGDLLTFGKACNLSRRESSGIIDRTIGIFSEFRRLAKQHALEPKLARTVESQLLLSF